MNKLKFSIASIMTLFFLDGMAQASAENTQNNSNYLEILLIVTSILLVFVIWGLSQILITVSRSILKKKQGGSNLKSLMIIFMSTLLAKTASSQPSSLIAGIADNPGYAGMHPIAFYALSTVIGIEIAVILFLALMVNRSFKDLSGEVEQASSEKIKSFSIKQIWDAIDKKWLTKAVPIEKEADLLLDHDYDGIRELDNALPPWWKYGFYVTLVIAVFYMMNFHFGGPGKNPEQEYAAEIEAGKKDEELYKLKTKDLVDENNVAIADANGIEAGKLLYTQSCVACHGSKGEGGIGPNLTDDYWIHGGNMNSIYHTIKIGYPEKGMQSWQSMYSPVQIKNLASFVKSIKGTKPANPKAPQGDLFQENDNNVTDSLQRQTK